MFKWTLCLLLLSNALHSFAQSTDAEVRDPTTPLGLIANPTPTNSEHHYELDSVLISAQRKLVVINGNSLREGQVIPGSGGVKVQRISPQKVVLQQGPKSWALNLSPTVVNRR